MSAEHARRDVDTRATHHEASDVNVRSVIGFAVALVAVAVVLHVAVWLLFRFYARGADNARPAYQTSVQQEMPATPRLQTNPRQDLLDLRAQEDTILSTYGWADRNANAVRIPIDQAIKLTLERGLPARHAPAPPAATSSGAANSGRIVGALEDGKK